MVIRGSTGAKNSITLTGCGGMRGEVPWWWGAKAEGMVGDRIAWKGGHGDCEGQGWDNRTRMDLATWERGVRGYVTGKCEGRGQVGQIKVWKGCFSVGCGGGREWGGGDGCIEGWASVRHIQSWWWLLKSSGGDGDARMVVVVMHGWWWCMGGGDAEMVVVGDKCDTE